VPIIESFCIERQLVVVVAAEHQLQQPIYLHPNCSSLMLTVLLLNLDKVV
jgi:hypothetical protein